MNSKLILLIFLGIFFLSFTSAEITSLDKTVVFPGDTIQLTIRPSNAGFYNVINVHNSQGNVVDAIIINCATVCKKKTVKQNYAVPSTFLGNYYFATFDYAVNGYELDYFNVIEQGGATQGTLNLVEMKSVGALTNLVVFPNQGSYSNISVRAELNDNSCNGFNVSAYLCNETHINNCSSFNYNYNFSLNFILKQGNLCTFAYVGEDYFPFYLPPGNWEAVVKSGILIDSDNFTYSALQAINYSYSIVFGSLNAQVWNVGLPNEGVDLINFGNVPTRVSWESDGFSCVSVNCTDFWQSSFQGEDRFQIDDDTLFSEANETDLNPAFITNYSVNYFPQANLSVCVSENCNNSIGERIKTFFNLKIPSIERGEYMGDIKITMS